MVEAGYTTGVVAMTFTKPVGPRFDKYSNLNLLYLSACLLYIIQHTHMTL